MKIKCNVCDGFYTVREGKYGLFGGCSKFPNCKSTLRISDLIFNFFVIKGINIYKWEKECYRCKNMTFVYSYFLYYELEELDEIFSINHGMGIGDISWIDNHLTQQIKTIKKCFSKTTSSSYIANTCSNCDALQGRNYVVSDPHEIITDLWHDHTMYKYLHKNIPVTNNDFQLLSNFREVF